MFPTPFGFGLGRIVGWIPIRMLHIYSQFLPVDCAESNLWDWCWAGSWMTTDTNILPWQFQGGLSRITLWVWCEMNSWLCTHKYIMHGKFQPEHWVQSNTGGVLRECSFLLLSLGLRFQSCLVLNQSCYMCYEIFCFVMILKFSKVFMYIRWPYCWGITHWELNPEPEVQGVMAWQHGLTQCNNWGTNHLCSGDSFKWMIEVASQQNVPAPWKLHEISGIISK
jgi:hypothetical protein